MKIESQTKLLKNKLIILVVPIFKCVLLEYVTESISKNMWESSEEQILFRKINGIKIIINILGSNTLF